MKHIESAGGEGYDAWDDKHDGAANEAIISEVDRQTEECSS